MNSTINLRTLIVAAILAYAASSDAQTAEQEPHAVIGVNLASIHNVPGMNNLNPGIYYRSINGYGGGIYINSQRAASLHVEKSFCMNPSEQAITGCLALGVVTGYKEQRCGVLVMPSVSYRGGRISVIPGRRSVALHLSWEFKAP